MHKEAAHSRRCLPTGETRLQLDNNLASPGAPVGAELSLLQQFGASAGCGATLTSTYAERQPGSVESSNFEQRVVAAMAGGLPVTVVACELDLRPGQALVEFESLCRILRAAMDDTAANSLAIEIALPWTALPPRVALEIRKLQLGPGRLWLLAQELSNGTLSASDDAAPWRALWELRGEHCVATALAPFVSSVCPLLAAEPAFALLPAAGLQVPAGTAWVIMQLDLAALCDSGGEFDPAELRRILTHCIDQGDALHDVLAWPLASMRTDAWLNRRLAIEVVGIGDLVLKWRVDPRSWNCAARIETLLQQMRTILREQSQRLALESGNLPSLDGADPGLSLPAGSVRDHWRSQWQRAVTTHRVRHRNLLTMSPWSVFPRAGPVDLRYADLLSVLQYADAGAFHRTVSLENWNMNEFKYFHQQAWAAFKRRERMSQVAREV